MPFNLQSSVLSLVLACVLPCNVLLAQERQKESAPAADAPKAWYAFYQHEAAHAYRFNLERGNLEPVNQERGDVELELDPTPILRWTNPLEEGSIHGVVYVWRHKKRPVVVGQLFSYLNGKGGRVLPCHAQPAAPGRKADRPAEERCSGRLNRPASRCAGCSNT